MLFLDKKNQQIADEILNHGTIDHAPVYPREVVRRALEVSASAKPIIEDALAGRSQLQCDALQTSRTLTTASAGLRNGPADLVG